MKKELFDKNPVLNLSFQFALSVIGYCEELNERKKSVISNQLLRSGTSIGANAMEAQNAESKADFVHKMSIAAKEAEETQYWLRLCKHSNGYPSCDLPIDKLDEVNRVLGTIINTARKNSLNNKKITSI
jgi:four helix bundle protein